MKVEVQAPAKINLSLHVTGQRRDGYHILDSLVAFASIGDTVIAEPAAELNLQVMISEAETLQIEGENLVLQAARWLDPDGTAALKLMKRLPVSAGLGGGSTDAAATIRALCQLWGKPLPAAHETGVLGADLPVCMAPGTQRMRGVGTHLEPAPDLPAFDVVLVNPKIPLSTPDVFSALASKRNPAMEDDLPKWRDAAEFAAWLRLQRNDLEAPAQSLVPEIGDCLALLRDAGALVSRMSGSGASCYGLFLPDGNSAKAATAQIFGKRPGYWCSFGSLI